MARPKKLEKQIIKKYRPPIVTIMGHVDHGKTSILDYLRHSRLTAKEAGGITQQIGAYTVEKNGKKITFIDTPGHEAFSQMRARGGAASDIVILVVAADDGVMPQTKEALMHAKAAEVPIIVAINKMDLPSADPMKAKRQLAEAGLLVEGFGGDVPVVEISAVTGKGMDELLDVISLIGEMNAEGLEADSNNKFEGIVIEARHDSKKGIMVSVVSKNGTLKLRDELISKTAIGRVRSLSDSYSKPIKEAYPGDAVEVLGFDTLPGVGDVIYKKDEQPADIFTVSTDKPANKVLQNNKTENGKSLNIVFRADTLGTEEALKASLEKLAIDETKVNILFSGTGEIKESDVLLASSSSAVVIAFKVKVPEHLYSLAKANKIIIREHDIIYKVLEEIEGALEGVIEIEESKIKGNGFIIEKFVLPKSGAVIAGTLVEAGKLKVGNRVGIFRGDNATVPVYVARIRSIHIGRDEVEIAKKGQECGLLFKPELNDIQLDDSVRVL
jgi:translation initiation factor IF-2